MPAMSQQLAAAVTRRRGAPMPYIDQSIEAMTHLEKMR
jgi:hypothetical protein